VGQPILAVSSFLVGKLRLRMNIRCGFFFTSPTSGWLVADLARQGPAALTASMFGTFTRSEFAGLSYRADAQTCSYSHRRVTLNALVYYWILILRGLQLQPPLSQKWKF
jgi:hypothetical protein